MAPQHLPRAAWAPEDDPAASADARGELVAEEGEVKDRPEEVRAQLRRYLLQLLPLCASGGPTLLADLRKRDGNMRAKRSPKIRPESVAESPDSDKDQHHGRRFAGRGES